MISEENIPEASEETSPGRIKAPATDGDAPAAAKKLRGLLLDQAANFTCVVRKYIEGKRTFVMSESNLDWDVTDLARNLGCGKYDLWYEWTNPDGSKSSASYLIPVGGDYYEKLYRENRRRNREDDLDGGSDMAQPGIDMNSLVVAVTAAIRAAMPPTAPQGIGMGEIIQMMRADADRSAAQQQQFTQMLMAQQAAAQSSSAEMTKGIFGILGQALLSNGQHNQPNRSESDSLAVLDKVMSLTKGMVEVKNMITAEPERETVVDRLFGMVEKNAPMLLALLATPRPIAKKMASTYIGEADPQMGADLAEVSRDPAARAKMEQRLEGRYGPAKAKAAMDILAGAIPAKVAQAEPVASPEPVDQPFEEETEDSEELDLFVDDDGTMWDASGNHYSATGEMLEEAPSDDAVAEAAAKASE